ncbi:unnamed protein product [Arctogadus glacialis]
MKILQIYSFLLVLDCAGSAPPVLTGPGPAPPVLTGPGSAPPVLTGPGSAPRGSKARLLCTAAASPPPVTYQLMMSRRVVATVTRHQENLPAEFVITVKEGSYHCTVTAGKNTATSNSIRLQVMTFLSQPRISFSFSQEAGGYEGAVICWTSTGSPPASFSLSLDGEEVASHNATASMTVTFPVAMEPAQDMGAARCRVKTDIQDLWSETQPLVVVPVGGHVELEVEYLYGADSKMAAAQLHCRPGRGTFPSFSWLLNGAGLPADLRPAPPLHAAPPRSIATSLVDGCVAVPLSSAACVAPRVLPPASV